MKRLLIGMLALSLVGCVRPLVGPPVTSPGTAGPVGALYDSRLRVRVGPPRGVQTLPLGWSHVRLTVSSAKLHAPLVQEVPTGGTQVALEFMVPPGDLTVTAEMLLSGVPVATGTATQSISPGANQDVEIALTTSRTTINTLSGLKAPYLGDGKAAIDARLSYPSAMAVDAAGNVYVADLNHHRIRRIDANAPHTVTTVAGHNTALSGPKALTLDDQNNLYFVENGSSKLYRLALGTGTLVHVMNLPASHSLVYRGGFLYVSDALGGRILKVDPATQTWTEFVSGNPAAGGVTATLNAPQGLALTPDGNGLYVSENGAHRVHLVDLVNKTIAPVAGNGTPGTPATQGMPAQDAPITNPDGLAVDALGNLYIAARYGHQVYMVNSAGSLTTVAGTGYPGFSGDGGSATAAKLEHPGALAVEPGGSLYIGDTTNNRIRKVFGAVITTFAGNGNLNFFGGNETLGIPLADAAFGEVERVAVDESGNVYVADPQNARVRILANATETRFGINLVAGRVHTVLGTGVHAMTQFGGPSVDSTIDLPRGLVLDGLGNLYVADAMHNVIVKVDKTDGTTSRLAGYGGSGYMDGPGNTAMFSSPEGMAFDPANNKLYVADRLNQRVREIALATGDVSTFAGIGASGSGGDEGPANVAQFNWPTDVALDASGNVFVADANNHKVRMICQAAGTYFGLTMLPGYVYSVAGTGTSGYPPAEGVAATGSPLNGPRGVEIDHLGNLLVADTQNNRVRIVQRATGVISALVGFQSGSQDGLGGVVGDFGTARLWGPVDVARHPSGRLFIADQYNYSVRQALPSGL